MKHPPAPVQESFLDALAPAPTGHTKDAAESDAAVRPMTAPNPVEAPVVSTWTDALVGYVGAWGRR